MLQSPSLLQPKSRGREMMPRRTAKTQQALSSVWKTRRLRGVPRSDGAHGDGPGRHVPRFCAPQLRGLLKRHTKSGGGGGGGARRGAESIGGMWSAQDEQGAVGGAFGGVDCRAGIAGGLVWRGLAGEVKTALVEATNIQFAAPGNGHTAGGLGPAGSLWCTAAVGAIACSGQERAEEKERGEGVGIRQEESVRAKDRKC